MSDTKHAADLDEDRLDLMTTEDFKRLFLASQKENETLRANCQLAELQNHVVAVLANCGTCRCPECAEIFRDVAIRILECKRE